MAISHKVGRKSDEVEPTFFATFEKVPGEKCKKMCALASRQNCVSELIPYTLPQLHLGKKDYVDFYCFDPVSNSMRRKKYCLNRYKTTSEKKARGSELIAELTVRLRSGWNVWVKVETTREHTLFSEVIEIYKSYCLRSAEKGTIKKKSAYGYITYLGMLTDWLDKQPTPLKFCYQIDQYLLSDFLEHILIDRESSARTRNNYLGWLSSFCSWMVSKGYLKENPTAKIPKLKEEPKKRNALSLAEISTLQRHLSVKNKHYLLACLMEYYTFIRPIELVQIKLEHINITEQKVFVPGYISKNKKDGMVGLNDTIIRLMIELRIFDHPNNSYLFGRDFRPSQHQACGRIFRDYFMKLREELHWDDTKQFYSLKDSGIRDLANAEGIVVARDQARHSDISTTNKYLKGDNLTVHEETKHFKGAFGHKNEEAVSPTPTAEAVKASSSLAKCQSETAQSVPAREESAEVLTPLTKEPLLTDNKVQEKREQTNVVSGDFDAKREVQAVSKEPTARAVKAAPSPSIERSGSTTKEVQATTPDNGIPPLSRTSDRGEAARLGVVGPGKEVRGKEETTESKANQARDFAALLKGKVQTKKKRLRIGQEKIYTSTNQGETTKFKGRPKPKDYYSSTSKK